jgi:hypothetical protein
MDFTNVVMNLYKDEIETDLSDLRKAIVAIAKGEVANVTNVLQNLTEKEEKVAEKAKKEKFSFKPNNKSLSEWKVELARKENVKVSKEYVHWKIQKGQAYMNVNANSWEKNEQVEGLEMINKAKAEAEAAGRAITKGELDKLWDDTVQKVRQDNWEKAKEVQEWAPLARDECNDVRMEDSLIIFRDNDKLKPHWNDTFERLSTFGIEKGYTMKHYKNCLDRWVSYFSPELMIIIKNLNPDEAATFLIGQSPLITNYEAMRKKLESMVRYPDESITIKMSYLEAIVSNMYNNAEEPERSNCINRFMMDGLLNFTTGRIRQEVSEVIDDCRKEAKTIDWTRLMKAIDQAEEEYGKPTEILRFNEGIEPTM